MCLLVAVAREGEGALNARNPIGAIPDDAVFAGLSQMLGRERPDQPECRAEGIALV